MATTKQVTGKKKATDKSTSTSGKANGREVTIRMYNVGFGDAFLVRIPDGRSERRILFDCGSIEASPGVPINTIVERIVHDVTDPDGAARIDVVVATHRHKDHVSGFGQPAWNDVQVKEVWMPWTEHPTDTEARRIRTLQSNLALGLESALEAKAAALGAAGQAELRRYQDVVANALMLSNDKAMKTLHSGFSGNPKRRFLPETTENKNNPRILETDVLPGIKVHVMGPSRDPDVIRDMDPPKGESFLRMRGAVDLQSGLPPMPFAPEFRQDSYFGAPLEEDDKQEIQRAGSLSDLAVAVALDRAVNGTSLMLTLEIAGTYLLFPGDAQWGTWSAVLGDAEWRELLTRVSFYKIGHHGSHNATPKDFVDELIPSGLCAMASTLTRAMWPDIPRSPLLQSLIAKKADLARSDQPRNIGPRFHMDNGVVETRIPL